VLDEIDFSQPNTCDALMLFGAEMCNLGSMSVFWCILARPNS
jgi:hypothetical protein